MTPAQDKQEIVRRLMANRERLAALGVQTLALFGSFARGEQRVDSDVDLLIDLASGPRLFDRYMDASALLSQLLGREVHLSTVDNMNVDMFLDYIEEDVIPLIGELPEVRRAI
jgi:predicted nucleotidyltransferase